MTWFDLSFYLFCFLFKISKRLFLFSFSLLKTLISVLIYGWLPSSSSSKKGNYNNDFNPRTGYLMIDDLFDAGGNPSGTNRNEDYHSW